MQPGWTQSAPAAIADGTAYPTGLQAREARHLTSCREPRVRAPDLLVQWPTTITHRIERRAS